jgi:hypothetical protein
LNSTVVPLPWPNLDEVKQNLARFRAERFDEVYLQVPRPLHGSHHASTG